MLSKYFLITFGVWKEKLITTLYIVPVALQIYAK